MRDRAIVAELALKQYDDEEIRLELAKRTGLMLSRQQINYDRQKVRKAWQQRQLDAYDELMNIELARIDVLERTIWKALEQQMEPKTRTEVEKALRDAKTDEELELVVTKTRTIVEESAANASYFSQIADCQKERRKLLGMYAPQQLDIHKAIVVKGYAEVSPNDWPSVLEGEIVKE